MEDKDLDKTVTTKEIVIKYVQNMICLLLGAVIFQLFCPLLVFTVSGKWHTMHEFLLKAINNKLYETYIILIIFTGLTAYCIIEMGIYTVKMIIDINKNRNSTGKEKGKQYGISELS